MNFFANYCFYLLSSGNPTPVTVSYIHQIPKDTNLRQLVCINLHWHKHNLYRTVSSRHSYSLHLSDTGELLGSSLGGFTRGKGG